MRFEITQEVFDKKPKLPTLPPLEKGGGNPTSVLGLTM